MTRLLIPREGKLWLLSEAVLVFSSTEEGVFKPVPWTIGIKEVT